MQKRGLFGMNGFLIFLLCCFSITARSQKSGYLILLEAENKTAFTVRLGEQFYVSSGHGSLVLSNLRDSNYRLNIRIPVKSRTELVFPVKVRQKDQGFLLQGADSVWILYNWQTKETIHSLKEKDSSRFLDQGVKREDGFSKLMAAVVNDSSVMYNTYTGRGFEKDSSLDKAQSLKLKAQSPDSTNAKSKDSTAVAKSERPTANGQPPAILVVPDKKAEKDSLAAAKKTKDSLISLVKTARKDSLQAARKTRDSLVAAEKAARKDSLLAIKRTRDSLTAVAKAVNKDTANSQRSTANAIPSTINHPPPTPVIPPPAANGQPSTANAIPSTINHPPSTIKKLREVSLKISRKMVFLDIAQSGITDTVTLFIYFETGDSGIKNPGAKGALAVKSPATPDSAQLNRQAEARNNLSIKAVESGCGQLATDADVEFLRSAILKANTEDDKIRLGSAAFDLKCFSVAQIRILAGLFVSDKARYRLMEAAHLHIADPEHFRELSNMYTDKNFQRKFLALPVKRG